MSGGMLLLSATLLKSEPTLQTDMPTPSSTPMSILSPMPSPFFLLPVASACYGKNQFHPHDGVWNCFPPTIIRFVSSILPQSKIAKPPILTLSDSPAFRFELLWQKSICKIYNIFYTCILYLFFVLVFCTCIWYLYVYMSKSAFSASTLHLLPLLLLLGLRQHLLMFALPNVTAIS